jgi:hypothetical protein
MLPDDRGGWARLNHHRHRDHRSLDATDAITQMQGQPVEDAM